jgi:photosystem II stability/assembly factor-like uncharacterized protein
MWTFAAGRTFVTTDGGLQWTSDPSGVDLAGSTMQFVDRLHGWAVSNAAEDPFLFGTVDGGRTWRTISAIRLP